MTGRLRAAAGSLRWRLTLVYVALVALLLVALATFQYVTLERNLDDVRAASLRGDVAEAVGVLDRAGAPAPGGGRPAARLTAAALRAALCVPSTAAADRQRAAQAVATNVSLVAGGQAQVLVLDRSLAVLAHAPAATAVGDIPRLDSAPLDAALAGRTPAAARVDTAAGTALVAAVPLYARGTAAGACAVVQVSASTAAADTVLARTLRLLAAGSAAVLLIALLVGLWLTGRTLTPLRRLTLTAGRLARGDLRARSGVEPRQDEVGTLARSFDDMAERIESAFAAQAESEARMRRFVADASHELRTPVTALSGYVDVLRRGAGRDPVALDAALGAMARESERMRVLVLDLLTLARLDAARAPAVERLDLAEVVAAVLDDGVPCMPPVLQRDLGEGAAHLVLGHRGSVVTIVRNLLVNACRYAPGAAQRWSIREQGGWTELVVTDEGPGIDAADLPHVFERFYRGEKTRAREEGGSGLGLSIVQGLARAMGGDVDLESAEARGTTVTVRLRPAPADGPAVNPGAPG